MAASNVKPTARRLRYVRQPADLTGTSCTRPATVSPPLSARGSRLPDDPWCGR
jgi:hypothetical protein